MVRVECSGNEFVRSSPSNSYRALLLVFSVKIIEVSCGESCFAFAAIEWYSQRLNTQDLLLRGLKLGIGEDTRFMQLPQLLQLRNALIR